MAGPARKAKGKRIAALLFSALAICLAACAPGAAPTPPNGPAPAEGQGPTVSDGVMLPNGALPDSGYKPPKTPERYYPEQVRGLIPSDGYGRIWPYIGGYAVGPYSSPREYFGICDEAGKIVCDPVYSEARLIENGEQALYAFTKTSLRAIDDNADPFDYEDKSEVTLATLDGSYAETFEKALWEEARGFEYSIVRDKDGFAYTYEWRGPVGYDYITAWRGGKWGVLGWDGSLLLPFEYREPVCFYEGLAAALSEDGRTYSFIDIEGRAVLGPYEAPPRLGKPWPGASGAEIPVTDRIMFYEGSAKFYEGGKFGIVGRGGEVVIPAEHDYISCMEGGIALFVDYDYQGGEYPAAELIGVVNDSGTAIVEPAEFAYWDRPSNEGGCAVLYRAIELKVTVAWDGTRAPYEIGNYYYYDGNHYVFLDTDGNRETLPADGYGVDVLCDDLLIVFDWEAGTWRLYDFALRPLSEENPGTYATWPYNNGRVEYFFIMEREAGWKREGLRRIYGLDGSPMLDGKYRVIMPVGDRFMVRGDKTAGLVDRNGGYIIEVSVAGYNAD